MKVKDLKKALEDLGPEYDESLVMVNQPGMSPPIEATRIITIPKFTGLSGCYSFEEFDNVVWILEGGAMVSKQAEAEGWKVAYLNLEKTSADRNTIDLE